MVPDNATFKYTNEGDLGDYVVESTMRWVWDANRAKPVQEKATLNFGMDGNLILAVADADGTVAWQTDTANKDVVILCWLIQRDNWLGKVLITLLIHFYQANLYSPLDQTSSSVDCPTQRPQTGLTLTY